MNACHRGKSNVSSDHAGLLEDTKCVFRNVYPHDEREIWDATYGLHDGSAKIYGEIPPDSITQLIDELHLGPDSVFYDLGSGIGRMVLQVHLTTAAKKACGIEIAEERHNIAQKALKNLEKTGLTTLLPDVEAPQNKREVLFEAQNFTEMDISDATSIYMASLFFPKEVMWQLAHKLSALKDGTRILSLVKFPFDDYGFRRLPKDSPLQALQLLGRRESMRMTWGEDNSIYMYEVDRETAFAPPFDGEKATPAELIAYAFKKVKVNPDDIESKSLAEASWQTLQSLELAEGDMVCELGSAAGTVLLRLGLESTVSKAIGVVGPGPNNDAPARVRAQVEELAPGRIVWHRRIAFETVTALEPFVSGRSANVTSPSGWDFSKACGDMNIVLFNGAHFGYEDELSALLSLTSQLQPGSVIIVLGLKDLSNSGCVPGLMPVMSPPVEVQMHPELGLTSTIAVFVTTPKVTHIAKLGVPGFGSFREAVAFKNYSSSDAESQVATKLKAKMQSGNLQYFALREVLEMPRFKRMQRLVGGLEPKANAGDGVLQFKVPSAKGIPPEVAAKWYLSVFAGSQASPYNCLEAHLYALAPYAPQITNDERPLFPEHTATYGEMDPRGIDTLLRNLGGLNNSDVFFDLGSGLGKVVLQVFLSSSASRCVGVELSTARFRFADEALKILRHRFSSLDVAFQGRSLEFEQEDVLKADFSKATVIWLGSLAFTGKLMAGIAKRILETVEGRCTIVSMLEFPKEALSKGDRKLVKRETWSVQVRWNSDPNAGKVSVYDLK